MTQYARPDSDLVTGNWSPSTGSSLYAVIDEETASDSDYISVTDDGSGTLETCEVGLESVTDPEVTTGHSVVVRAYTDSYYGSVYLSVKLKTSSDTIKTSSFTPSSSFANFTMSLSSSEASDIGSSGYADLRVEIAAIDSFSSGSQTRVSQVYFSCPDAPAGTTVTPDAAAFVTTATATVDAPITITPAAAVIECEDWIPKFIVGDKTVIRTPLSETWGVRKYYDSSYTYEGCDSQSAWSPFGASRNYDDYWLRQNLTAWWFPSVDLPECYNVSNAVIKFKGTNTPYIGTNWNTNSPRVTIYGDDTDDATYTDLWSCTGYNSHTLTTANETWYPPKTPTSGAMQEQTTDDISSVVNEIRNRSGWDAGNNMQFFFENPLPRFSSGYTGWLVTPHINRHYGRVAPVLEITYDGTGTVKKTIGSSTTHGTSTPTSSTTSSPTYTVGFDTAVTGVSVGDKVFFEDYSMGYGEEYIYKVAAINSTTSFDLTFVSGGTSGDVTPYGNLYAADFSQASGTFKSVYDYTSPQAWINDFNDTTIYCDGDNAIGVISVNEKYDEGLGLTCNQSNHTLASITLTVAESVRHNGTAGSGAGLRFTSSGAQSAYSQWVYVESSNITIEWLEWDGTGASSSAIAQHFFSTVDNDVGNIHLKNNLMYGLDQKGGGIATRAIRLETPSDTVTATCSILNNIVYDIDPSTPSGGDCVGIYAIGGRAENAIYVYNNTVHHIVGTGTASGLLGYGRGIQSSSHTYGTNNIVTDVTAPVTADDFYGNVHADSDYNLSTDTTAAGSNSVTSATLANIYVSNSGTIILHLKAGSPAIDAGYDLGTSPTGVNIDIDGRDRDSEGDTWDIGADEYVLNGIEVTPAVASFVAAAITPTVDIALLVSPAAASFVADAPTPTTTLGNVSVTPTAAAFVAGATLSGASTGDISVTPAVATVIVAGVNPTVSVPASITPPAATIIVAGVSPTITAGTVTITPAVASTEVVVISPSVVLGSLTFTATATLEAAAISPQTTLSGITLQPSAATVVVSTVTPTTTMGAAIVTPAAGIVQVAGITPDVLFSSTTATPTAAVVETNVTAIVKQESITLTPPASVAVAEPVAPTVVLGAITISPNAAAATTDATYAAIIQGGQVVLVAPAAKLVYTATDPTLVFGSTTATPAAAEALTGASVTAINDDLTVTPAASVVVTSATISTILAGVTVTPTAGAFVSDIPPVTIVASFDSAAVGYWIDGRPDYSTDGAVEYNIDGVLDYETNGLTHYSIDGRPDYSIGDEL